MMPETATEPDASARREHAVALAITLAGLVASILMGVVSDGFYHDDDVGHYLFARDSWRDSSIRWDMWSRPGYNLPVMPVVRYFGMAGCRVFSALQTAAVAFLAYLIARRISERDRGVQRLTPLAPALVWLQPLVMTLSLTTLTETTGALYLSLGVWLYLRGNRVWACAALSALFVTRYELTALAPIPALALFADAFRSAGGNYRNALRTPWLWGALAALLWAPAAYLLAAAGTDLRPDASPFHIFGEHYTEEYGRGDWDHMLRRWPIASGIGVLALAAAGAARLRRRAWLPATFAVGGILVHSLIYYFGAFASGGYERFLVPLAGPVAALTGCGIASLVRPRTRLPAVASLAAVSAGVWCISGAGVPAAIPAAAAAAAVLALQPRARRIAATTALAVAAALAIAQFAGQVRPLRLEDNRVYVTVRECLQRLERTTYADSPGWTSHVIADWLSDDIRWIRHDPTMIRTWRSARPGRLYVWDSKYSGGQRTGEPEDVVTTHVRELGRKVAEFKDPHSPHSAAVYVRVNVDAGD
ncbi:MAG: hypothetical protein ACOC9S_03010 [Planctomycetota bacterium]